MNKLMVSAAALVLLSASAVAADLPARVAGPAPAPAVYVPLNDWTGGYVGISGGWVWGETTFDTEVELPNNSVKHDGGIVGGQIGYTFQFASRWIVGAVADISWTGSKGSVCVDLSLSCTGDPGDSYATQKVGWLATFRGNLGFAFSNDLLAYVTGGLAVAGTEARISHIDGANDPDAIDKATRVGFAAGGGWKYRPARSWSVGIEYIYAHFGKHRYTFTSPSDPSDTFPVDAKTHLNILRGSINYEFGGSSPSPVVARY
jgi:opacity protein-like surface antigen